MKLLGAVILLCSLLLPSVAEAAPLPPGLYRTASGHSIYVGIEHELPDPPVNQFFDPTTQRFGDLPDWHTMRLVRGIREARRIVRTAEGPLGVSLYYADDRKRATVILIHGNDPETRQMGFLIPYFVLHGLNVISYDQRGTGNSTGNWFLSGPPQRALDADALFDAFATDRRVDRSRIGVWGFSNGGWTAPIVATQRPVAFMLLKSAPAESIEANVLYEARENMRRYHENGANTAHAIRTWRAIVGALAGTAPWPTAERLYANAEKQSWFAHSLLPPGLHLPLRGAAAEGYRHLIFYDPAQTLRKVRTPTLALFGANDRRVDVAHAVPTLRADFRYAGMRDFTLHVFPRAGHTLVVSNDGFTSEEPERLAAGYPHITLTWLRARGFLTAR